MKNNMRKGMSVFFAAMFLLTLFPLQAAALPAHLTYATDGKVIPANDDIRTPASLSDGEVYTYTTVAGEPLPSTDFTIGLSALGQRYSTTETSVVPTVTVLVVDTSGSMDYDIEDTYGTNTNEKSRMEALKEAANTFVDSVAPGSGGTNYVAVVTYSTYSYKALEFTNSNSALKTKITNLDAGGGTNTHGGLIAAYKMINNPTSYGLTQAQISNAAYSVVFMSDGEPTYYYRLTKDGPDPDINAPEVYNNFSFNSSGQLTKGSYGSAYTLSYDGPGSDSNSDTTGNAQSAANILKTNGTRPTVYSVYIYNEDYSDAEATMNAIASSADKTYTPDDADALTDVFEDIAVNIKNVARTPIAETEVSGTLAPASFVNMAYELGTGYILPGDTMTIHVGGTPGTDYILTKAGGSYTCSAPGYNENMTVTVADGVITWLIPASALPCNSPEPAGGGTQTFASPITLSFTVRFDENAAGLAAGTYPTASLVTASFYPTGDNPFYYASHSTGNPVQLAQNTTNTYDVTTYYAATYPWPGNDRYYGRDGHGFPTLTGFGTGDSSSSISYIGNPAAVSVNSYSDSSTNSSDVMTLTYDNGTIQFNGATRRTARASFSTTNKANPTAYTVSSFSDGTTPFDDAYVSAVSGSDVTITYGETGAGKRSVIFKNVSFSESVAYETRTVTAKFQGYYGSSSWIQTLSMVELNGQAITPRIIPSSNYELDYYSGNYDYFDIDVQIDNLWYAFNDVQMYWKASSSTSDTVTGTSQVAVGTTYTANNKTQDYYSATASVTKPVTESNINFRFVYDNPTAPNTLTVQTKPPAAWATEGAYARNANTSIEPNDRGGYTIRQLSGGGSTLTTTTYSVEDNTLFKQVSTANGQNGVDLLTGIVTQTHSHAGAIVLSEARDASDYVTSVALKSLAGTQLATADSTGRAYLILVFETSEAVYNLDLDDALDADPGSGGTFGYSISGAARVGGSALTITDGKLPSVLPAGEYEVTFLTEAGYADPLDKLQAYTVKFNSLTFSLSPTGSELTRYCDTVDGEPGSEPIPGQQVKVVLVTPSGH